MRSKTNQTFTGLTNQSPPVEKKNYAEIIEVLGKDLAVQIEKFE
jgi:hypothetical protein